MLKHLVVAIVVFTAGASAQTPVKAALLDARSVVDSQAVLRELAATVRANPKDAPAYYRQGMIAWALSIRADAQPAIRGLDANRLREMADTSLRLAALIDTGRVDYQMSIGAFLRHADDSFARLAAAKFLDKAVALARTSVDTIMLARASVEAGRVQWLRYDSQAHQLPVMACPDVPQSLDSARTMRSPGSEFPTLLTTEFALTRMHNTIVDCMASSPTVGSADYEGAEALFRDAYRAAPDDARTFRHLSMLLAEKNRWKELAGVARDRINRQQADAWAWLVSGLALHRSGASAEGSAAFDSALTRLDAAERGRLFAFQRLLQRRDSASYAKSTRETQETWERSFWAMSDPLWSREGNDTRTEFLARVAFAELRWSVDELGVRGADSDRGEIYIRFGPPDLIVAIRGCNVSDCTHRAVCPAPRDGLTESPSARDCVRRSVPGLRSDDPRRVAFDPLQSRLPNISDVVTFWDYHNGLTIAFWGSPTYGTARFPSTDGPHIERVLELRAASFDNVDAERIVTMPLSVTRFRAAADSVDVLALAQAPMAEIRSVAANAPVRGDFWLVDGTGTYEFHDSTTLTASGLSRSMYRVAAGQYFYRAEATATGTMVAGRGTQPVMANRDTTTGFALRGFGISDLLFATIAQPAGSAPVRWTDFNIAPLLGALPRQAPLNIIWENYEFGSRSGQTQYTVAITIERQRGAAGQIAAAIVGLAANAVGITRRGDRLTMTFERAMPARPAFVDNVSVAMGETPPGDYRLTLEITDKVSGRNTSRVSNLRIQN